MTEREKILWDAVKLLLQLSLHEYGHDKHTLQNEIATLDQRWDNEELSDALTGTE